MIQIKFRGYAPSIGWIYGNLIEKEDPRKEIPTPWVRLIHDRALSATKVDFHSVGQFTGLHDKNGVEIYPKDLLRIKGICGDNGEYKYDCIYSVNEINHEGLSLLFVKLFSLEPDSRDNSYPTNTSPSFKYKSLCVDYVNKNYDRLAIPDTWGENHIFRHRWKECHYTNDIEKIGNIYENPELMNERTF